MTAVGDGEWLRLGANRDGTLSMTQVAYPHFLAAAGEMAERTRAFEWSSTPIGPVEHWAPELRASVALLLASPHPMFIWWGPELVQFYNDAYRLTMGPERHPSALGQSGRECWAEIWDFIGPQIEQVMGGGGATWHEDQLVPVTRHGRREDVWWDYSYNPILTQGGVGGVLVICTDVTAKHKAVEQITRRQVRLAAARRRLSYLFDLAPGFMCVLTGPDHRFEMTNRAYLSLVGAGRSLIGKTVSEAIPEAAGQGFIAMLDKVYSSGEPIVGTAVPIFLRRVAGQPGEERFLDFIYQPIKGPAGDVTGIFVEGSDVTDRVNSLQRQSLLIRELHHRVRNTLAMVQGIMGATARSVGSIAEFREAFSGRIAALAKTHSLLTDEEGQTANLRTLIYSELELFDDGTGTRIILEGPDVELPSTIAVPIGMAVHELTTNAVKYGALSELSGSIECRWTLTPTPDGEQLTWLWREQNGPKVGQPSRSGFGTKLLDQVLSRQINAQVRTEFLTGGLQVVVSVLIPREG